MAGETHRSVSLLSNPCQLGPHLGVHSKREVLKHVAPSLQGELCCHLNLNKPPIPFAFSRLRMSPLRLTSVNQALFSIPSSCFASLQLLCRAVCRKEGNLRHLVSNPHQHRHLWLKERLVLCSHEKPFFLPSGSSLAKHTT